MAPEDRRQAIIEATLPLLLERGTEMSTREIAQAAGIAEGTIFRAFETKQDLIHATIHTALMPVDLVFANEAEAKGMAKTSDLNAAIAYLKTIGREFALTLGPQGALIYDGRELIEIAPVKTQALDTVGAGDMFAGACLYALTQGWDHRGAGHLAAAAAARLAEANSNVVCETHIADLIPGNIEDILEGSSLILDGTDNFDTRYLINDYAVQSAIPWIYGGAVGSYGLAMPVVPGRTAFFECIYPEPPSGAQPTCETAGVVNTLTAMVAAWQVSLALKIICRGAESVESKITTIDVWEGMVRQITMPEPDPACPACALRTCRHLQGEGRPPISLCGRNAVQIHDRRRPLDLAALAARLAPLGDVRANEFAIRFIVPPHEMTIFADGRAIVKGTTDPGLARSLYSRYIGN